MNEQHCEPLPSLPKGGKDATELRRALAGVRVGVLGDVMIDCYLRGRVTRISPEAPVPVVELAGPGGGETRKLGGAANVAQNLSALGVSATLFGAVGDDPLGEEFPRFLEAAGVTLGRLEVVTGRPTTLKTRILAQGQQLLRMDLEARGPLPRAAIDALYAAVLAAPIDVLLVSDYHKGVVDAALLPELIRAFRGSGRPVYIDPRVANFRAYQGADLVTPNRVEAEEAAGMSIHTVEDALRAGRFWLETLEAAAVLITLGGDGMLLLLREGGAFSVRAEAREVYDVTGAGDTAIAVMTALRAAGLNWETSLRLANYGAGHTVTLLGTATVGLETLLEGLGRAQSVVCLAGG